MLIGYIENGKAMDKMCEPFFQEIGENVVTEINIFDEENNLILEDDEKILLERKDDKFDVKNDWRPRQGVFNYSFEGHLYAGTTIITNKRILHYRVPDPNWAGAGKSHVMGIPDALLAREAKKLGMYEFCQINLSDIVKMLVNKKYGTEYYIFSEFKRYVAFSNEKANVEEFSLLEPVLHSREIERNNIKDGFTIEIYYVEPSFFTDIKKHWKRDDLLKKGAKFVKKKKYDKALIQYQQILEIFPNDEESKKIISELSNAK
ncbi:MAG: hypothetical protein KAS67_04950 [Thermoplasmata archaeon]|nr:hypothetical protein [Thermoplasmata archaeon]